MRKDRSRTKGSLYLKMIKKSLNITPDKSLMIKIGQKNYKIQEAIAELVDNSIDAMIPNEKLFISVNLLKDRIIVEDNGCGMNEKTFTNAVILGKSSKINKLGIYGLGLKTACVNLGKKFTIISSPKGEDKKYTFYFDEDEWMKIKSLNWSDYPYEVNFENKAEHYTKIIIEKLKVNLHSFGRRVENRIISDFGLRYGLMLQKGNLIIKISDAYVEPNFPQCEDESKINFDFNLIENDPSTRIYGWVGLKWDVIREKVTGSQKGVYGFITYRNGRLITQYDDLKVDNEIFAIRRHPQWATIIGVVNMDCVPIESDKRNFIQEHPLYVSAIQKIREYVKQIEEVIKGREGESEIAEDIKEITEELTNAAEKALGEEEIKNIIEENSDEEGINNYGKLIKKSIGGRIVRGDVFVEDDKEYRNSVNKNTGSIFAKGTGKIRMPKTKIQKGRVKVLEEKYDNIDIELEGRTFNVKHQFIKNLTGDALRSWEMTDKGFFIVKTNISPLLDLTGKEYPVFALHNICESLSEFCLNTNDNSKIIELRDELIRKTYQIISTLS